MTLLAALAAAGAGLGVWLVIDGLRPRPLDDLSPMAEHRSRPRPGVDGRTVALAAGAAAVTGLVTRWPVGAAAAAAVVVAGPKLFGRRAATARATARTEAVAAWTEMLRDTIAGAHGLEETVAISAHVAPGPIRPEVEALAERLHREPLGVALRSFGTDLAHPTADLVVTALSLAAEGAVGDLNELLGTLAASAREEAAMRMRVEASRARLRTAVRVIAGCTLGFATALIVLNRSYLDAYAGPVGQLVLLVIAGLWGASLWWLDRLGQQVSPERFLATGTGTRQW